MIFFTQIRAQVNLVEIEWKFSSSQKEMGELKSEVVNKKREISIFYMELFLSYSIKMFDFGISFLLVFNCQFLSNILYKYTTVE